MGRSKNKKGWDNNYGCKRKEGGGDLKNLKRGRGRNESREKQGVRNCAGGEDPTDGGRNGGPAGGQDAYHQ